MRSARRRKTHSPTRTAFESLESRAMLAGLGPDAFSVLGSNNPVLLPGTTSTAGINVSGDSPTPGSSGGLSSPPTSSGSQSTGLSLPNSTEAGTGSSTTGSNGNSGAGGLALSNGSGSGTGLPTTDSSGSSNSGGLTLSNGSGSGTVSSTTGITGGSTVNGAAPPSFQAMPSLAEFLPSGYQLRPNSASDPVFQQAYAQWMASSAATSAANNTQTMQGSTSAAGSSSNATTTSGAWSVFDGEFWRNYTYYLTNPSQMDDGQETTFYIAFGTSAVAGTAAGGFAIAGFNPVLWGGGATAATSAAAGAAAVETTTIEGITYQVVTINSRYSGTVLVPNGWTVNQMGNTVWGVGPQVHEFIANPTIHPWMTSAWATSWASYYQWASSDPAFVNNLSAPARLQLTTYYEGLLLVMGM